MINNFDRSLNTLFTLVNVAISNRMYPHPYFYIPLISLNYHPSSDVFYGAWFKIKFDENFNPSSDGVISGWPESGEYMQDYLKEYFQ